MCGTYRREPEGVYVCVVHTEETLKASSLRDTNDTEPSGWNMAMSPCMYACMHACMYVCMCMYMCICLDMLVYVCMHVTHIMRDTNDTEPSGWNTDGDVSLHVCMYACMYVCMYMHVYVRMCTYV